MRIVHVSTYQSGGAATAAVRLHRQLLADGIDSQVVVSAKIEEEPGVVQIPGVFHRGNPSLASRLDYRLGRLLCPFGPKPWGPSILPGRALAFIESLRADVVHLHWVSHGLFSHEQIGRIRQPVVWTMHDMWPISPGYGYRMQAAEGLPGAGPFLPLLPGPPFHRLARNVWNRKAKAWRKLNAVLVSPSEWLAEEARRSDVVRHLPVRTIPNCVPLDTFRPRPRLEVRAGLGLPRDEPLVLFGADTSGGIRKGPDLLAAALARMPERPTLVVFGSTPPEWLRQVEFKIIPFGEIASPVQLAALYAACDVFACPSREDNLPNTILESMASGTPVVGFRVGGLPDLVQSGANGFLAEPFDPGALAEALARTLQIERADGSLGRTARKLAEERYEGSRIAAAYTAVYRELLSSAIPARPPAEP